MWRRGNALKLSDRADHITINPGAAKGRPSVAGEPTSGAVQRGVRFPEEVERGQRLLDRARGIKQERYGVIDQRQITDRRIDLRPMLALRAGTFLG